MPILHFKSNLPVNTKIAKPFSLQDSAISFYSMMHNRQHISFRIKPRRNHMHHIRHENDRDCEVGENTVRFLDQRQQAELGDEEVCDAASEDGEDLGASDFACGSSKDLACWTKTATLASWKVP